MHPDGDSLCVSAEDFQLCSRKYIRASAACCGDIGSCTECGIQSPPLWTISVELASISTDDQFVTYDLSFWIAMSTPNIIQNAEMISAFLSSNSSFAFGVIRSSMYAGLCVNLSLPGSPGSIMISFFISGDYCATSRM